MNLLTHYLTLVRYALGGNKGFYESREYFASLLIGELSEFTKLKGKKVIDVGGERGEFCKILSEKASCHTINLEPGKAKAGEFVWKTVKGRADKIPFKNANFDIVLFRGVLQHIPTDKKLDSLNEIYRVLKKGGLVYLMIPPWYAPLSGQEIKPFQFLGFPLAKHFSNTIIGRKIKENSLSELGIWPMTIYSTLKLVEKSRFKILKMIDIWGRLHFLTKIPIIKELLPSVGIILQK